MTFLEKGPGGLGRGREEEKVRRGKDLNLEGLIHFISYRQDSFSF